MAFPAFYPASPGVGMPRYGLGLFNGNVPSWRRQAGLPIKFFDFYTGFDTQANMQANSYYGVHQNDIAGRYTSHTTGIIPICGTSLATDDGTVTLATMAAGANDAHIQLCINNMFAGASYDEIWVRPGYEANIQTTASGYRGGTTWGASWKAAFQRYVTVARAKMASSFPSKTLRIVFDFCVLNSVTPGGNNLAAFNPGPAYFDMYGIDFYTGNYFPLGYTPWPGYFAQTPFTLNVAAGPAPAGATVDGWTIDFDPAAAPNGKNYGYDNAAHFLTFQDGRSDHPNGNQGQSLWSVVQQAKIDEVGIFHPEFGGIAYQKVSGAITKGNGWTNMATSTIQSRLPDDFRAMNDLNYYPYMKRIWAAMEAYGVPALGGCCWDRSDGTLMSGCDPASGPAHPGMRSTLQTMAYPIGQYGAIDPVLVVNDIPALVTGTQVTIRVDTNYTMALANIQIDYGDGAGTHTLPAGAAQLDPQSITFPFTPTNPGTFNMVAHDTSLGYPSPASDYTVTGSSTAPPPAIVYSTKLTLTGPTVGVISTPSTAFTITPDNAGPASICTVTLSDDDSAGGFFQNAAGSPITTLVFPMGSAAPLQFTYVPGSAGTKRVSITNDIALPMIGTPINVVVPSPITPPPPPNPVSTSISLIGPSVGLTLTPTAAYTVTPDNFGPATICTVQLITDSDGAFQTAAGTPITALVFPANIAAPQQFYYLPATVGTKSISITDNVGLTVAGSPILVNVTSSVTPPPSNPPSTLLTLTGPSTGSVGNTTSAFIVTPNNYGPASSMVVTLSDNGGGGVFQNSTGTFISALLFPANVSDSQQFFYIGGASGNKSITITDSLGLAVSGSPVIVAISLGTVGAGNSGPGTSPTPIVDQLDGTQIYFPGRQFVPEDLNNDRQHRKALARAINTVMAGQTNNTIQVTLTPSAPTTTVVDPRISLSTACHCAPMTATAAAEVPTLFVIPQAGQAVIHHTTSAASDRVFIMSIQG